MLGFLDYDRAVLSESRVNRFHFHFQGHAVRDVRIDLLLTRDDVACRAIEGPLSLFVGGDDKIGQDKGEVMRIWTELFIQRKEQIRILHTSPASQRMGTLLSS